ncbi:extracellular solute-binding protein [Nocardioides sp. NPDC127503]|uniref:ABC transporter substrate-binding protein n=1 Tax=Nocardioides sp. NPDC127503 TaxID=3154516 RepID=UPI0033201B53
MRLKRGSHGVRIAAAMIATVSLVACSGPGGNAPAADTMPTDVRTDVGEDAATITLFTAAGLKDYQQGLADAFMEEHPAIEVELQVEADNNYNTVAPRLLASDDPPDLAIVPDLTGAVRDGLVTDLDAYDEAYGWSEKVPASVLDAGRVEDGAIGTGSLYVGGGAAGPLVGVFYNRELADKVGMTKIPANLDELEDVMAKAKSTGVTPIVASNADGLIGHLYNLLLGDYLGSKSVLDVVWRKPGASLDTPEAVEATARLQEWAKAGYFNEDANAINQDASYGRFASGEGLFMFQGSWMTQALPASFDGEYGVFPMPPLEEGDPAVSMTANTLAYSIASRSDEKNAAALFLDFLTSPEAAAVAAENGYPAAGVAGAEEVSLEADAETQIQAGYSAIAASNGFFSWIQNSVPAVNTDLPTQLQLLVSDKTTPEDAVGHLQEAYQGGLQETS